MAKIAAFRLSVSKVVFGEQQVDAAVEQAAHLPRVGVLHLDECDLALLGVLDVARTSRAPLEVGPSLRRRNAAATDPAG